MRDVEISRRHTSRLYSNSLFAYNNMVDDDNDMSDQNISTIFKKSIIVGGVDPKKENDNLQFLVKQNKRDASYTMQRIDD